MYDAERPSEKAPEVVMIDFAHTRRLDAGSVDDGYIFGCNELSRILRLIL